MNLTTICSQLQNDPDSLAWGEKVSLAARIGDSLGRGEKMPAPVVVALSVLADDSKWEVRKALTDLLHLLPEAHFNGLAQQLGGDDNHYVRNGAKKAMERRSRSQGNAQKTGRGLKKADSEIERIAREHGVEVAKVVREQAARLYEGLVGASVHEMRSVLTAMKGNVQSLLTEVSKGHGERAATRLGPRLHSSLDYMEQLLADMRLYTQVPPKKRHTELVSSLVQEALTMVQSEFSTLGRDTDGIEVALEIPAQLALPVSRAQIVLAIRNLIKNAHESFLLDDSTFGRGCITIRSSVDEEWVELQVEDNGMGLTEEELADVRQFIPGRSSKKGGTGFGLPIAQRNVSVHGGTVEIRSTDGKGTLVVVRLPMDSRAAA